MNYLISYKIHCFISPIMTFQIIKSESKIAAVKYFLDNQQETVDIIAISEIDDALTEVIRKYYDSESKSQSSTIAQKIDEAIKAPQKQLSESEAKRTLQDLSILDEQGNITAAYESIIIKVK